MMAQVFSEVGHILLAVSLFAWLGKVFLKSHRGAVVGFSIGAILTVLPLDYSPQFYTRSALGDLSALSWLFLIHLLCRSVYGVTMISREQGRAIAVVTVVGGLLIYPASLGAGLPDLYRLGFDSATLIYAFAAGALVYLLRGGYLNALWIIIAMLAFGLCLLESLNFWDCLFDYPSFVISSIILVRWCFRRSGSESEIPAR